MKMTIEMKIEKNKPKSWYSYERTFTRKELLMLCWACSVPFASWFALSFYMFMKPKKENSLWK